MSNMMINTNVLAINSHRAMKVVGEQQFKASARLSSGLRVNSAADDAAGLAISEKMRSQIRGLNQASRNAQDGISMVQTAEGGLQEINNMVQRIRELVVQAANDSNDYTTNDRAKIQNEIAQLIDEIDNMSTRVEFNNKKLISGAFSQSENSIFLQVGANRHQSIRFTIGNMGSTSLGINFLRGVAKMSGGATIATSTGVNVIKGCEISAFLQSVTRAVNMVADERAKLGAIQNRLEFTIRSLDISSENLSASESRIRDADMGKEMMNLTKTNVLMQAATSMLAQANQAPQTVLQLLR